MIYVLIFFWFDHFLVAGAETEKNIRWVFGEMENKNFFFDIFLTFTLDGR